MKFTIEKGILSENLNKVVGVVSTKSVMPILSGIYISVSEDEGITLIGSNGDLTIESVIPIELNGETMIDKMEAGNIVVPAKLMNDIVKKLPNDKVTLEVDSGYHAQVKSGKSKFNLNGQDANEYPKLPKIDASSFEIESSILKEVIRTTVFAVANVDTRPILTGVNISQVDDSLHFVATDSHRLSRSIVNKEVTLSENITIPGNTLKELNKILPDTDDLVRINLSNNSIMFDTGQILFYSRLLDGNFPDTSRLIPSSEQTSINASKKELLSSLERASVLTDNAIIKFTANGGLMAEISSNSPEVGNVNEDIVMANFEGEDITLSFSARYAIDALKAVNGDEIVINLNGSMKPFTIVPKDDKSCLQLVLPVRTY